MLRNIILYLLSTIQSLYQENGWLISFSGQSFLYSLWQKTFLEHNKNTQNACKRQEESAAKADDIFVSQMSSHSKINHVAFLLSPNKNSATEHDSSA